MDNLLALVRDTLTLVRPKAVPHTVLPPQEKKITPVQQVVQVAAATPLPKENHVVIPFSALQRAYLHARPGAKIIEHPPSDRLAKEKKERWKKQITPLEALLVFVSPCHPILFDIEQAIHTRLMSAALISLDELIRMEETSARLIIFEATLGASIDPLKKRFPECRFLEIPLASALASNPSLKKQVWQMLQGAR
jgi:hypothetical protein